jgi:hypothetical protein
MRAQEFITERDGKIGRRRQAATVGLNLFSDAERTNSDYVLNRVMMAVATADGSGDTLEVDTKSWVGKRRAAFPYTQVEQEMMKQAYKAAGAVYTDLNHGDLESEEHPEVHIKSPVIAFKGYPR